MHAGVGHGCSQFSSGTVSELNPAACTQPYCSDPQLLPSHVPPCCCPFLLRSPWAFSHLPALTSAKRAPEGPWKLKEPGAWVINETAGGQAIPSRPGSISDTAPPVLPPPTCRAGHRDLPFPGLPQSPFPGQPQCL